MYVPFVSTLNNWKEEVSLTLPLQNLFVVSGETWLSLVTFLPGHKGSQFIFLEYIVAPDHQASTIHV